mmetsp:Transcript_63966/g.169317  ORF Transcript_63966/g.169317 Transcript_63966/m.169317 type:complete len:246 (+) Transcript_63966:555-1292(+)
MHRPPICVRLRTHLSTAILDPLLFGWCVGLVVCRLKDNLTRLLRADDDSRVSRMSGPDLVALPRCACRSAPTGLHIPSLLQGLGHDVLLAKKEGLMEGSAHVIWEVLAVDEIVRYSLHCMRRNEVPKRTMAVHATSNRHAAFQVEHGKIILVGRCVPDSLGPLDTGDHGRHADRKPIPRAHLHFTLVAVSLALRHLPASKEVGRVLPRFRHDCFRHDGVITRHGTSAETRSQDVRLLLQHPLALF